ncbi:arginyl-tRNA synthetase [Desulforamulus reducens MI-1]|uniref:Arginine--tRNA ligase n=1 Tax=Desulforamulus reducens (strain ATCC BAA-1160 / DSM 100696 / MI-1) TaxID=349161 RepID=SYR_DESRM|nr:arginine--tRNA ligase [Desulforamulus reducens]A4J9D2.1 RecName: Full=Arginine--tRNA ligase; AltName: Full=Arginyl-tRNA synthetase; Short=ArgRS [Desulforamulus reducens MI-1]ABO51685.1 arginyl-tRNA synthetase [Desulforamulus reducens MI-1]
MQGLVENIKSSLAKALQVAIAGAVDKGQVNKLEIPEVIIEVPREKGHGDFATNLAMQLAKPAKMAPRKIAEAIIENLDLANTQVERVEIAGPGFINFYLQPSWVHGVIPMIIQEDRNYGRLELGDGQRVQVEFVSANPTGLLHMGNARGAALGDSLASILDFAGYRVSREYYINDAGNQIENFGKSLEVRYLQQLGQDIQLPEEGYHGEDIIDTVKGYINKNGRGLLDADQTTRRKTLAAYALQEKLTHIRNTLLDFGVVYDVWYSEQALHDSGAIQETLDELRQKGFIYEQENALWFKATAFGDEKDEVVVRSNGIPTYFAADIAYHKDKYKRGFDRVIDIWGADHHGHVNRMKGSMEALGHNRDNLQIILMQLVRLLRGGEVVRMSKRTGQFVTLEELVEEVGRDAARYFFVMRSPDSHLEFDLDLAKSQTNDNPVFYIQYAHARICSILRQLQEQGRPLPEIAAINPTVLKEEAELELLRKLADFPSEIAAAAEMMAPHRIARYLHDLAGLFHSFYNSHRVITENEAISEARLVLVQCVRIVLRNALGLLGLTAPEKM